MIIELSPNLWDPRCSISTFILKFSDKFQNHTTSKVYSSRFGMTFSNVSSGLDGVFFLTNFADD